MNELGELNASFDRLRDYLQRYDPIKLLSQVSLTFLCRPADQHPGDDADVIQWSRWIEFLAEMAVTREYPSSPETFVDGRNLEDLEKLLRDYFDRISRCLLAPQPGESVDDHDSIAKQAKSYSFFVRGEAYPEQLVEAASSLYSNYDTWFQNRLGFRIRDAIAIFKCIETELNRRLNDEHHSALEQAEQQLKLLMDEKDPVSAQEQETFKQQVFWQQFYGRSDELLSFTPEGLSALSGRSPDTCLAFLKRMSQEFGYVNPNFPEAFRDAQRAPWDYRSLYERPMIAREGRYFVLAIFLFPEALFETFYYDLIGDANYWPNGGQDIYGRWVESTTADYFKRVFPADEVLLNPYYSPDGKKQQELCDVLVLHDRKVLIVQCKAKRMRLESQMGESYETIREDLEKSVVDSFDQAVVAYNYLKSCYDQKQELCVTVSGKVLTVDVTEIVDPSSDVFLVSVLLGHYQNFITRLANINDSLALFDAGSYPWAISLADLDVLTDVLDSPAFFLHYAKRRTQVERTSFVMLGDELDLLGYYLQQGLYFDLKEFKGIGLLGLDGWSKILDDYMFERYTAHQKPEKPTQNAPDGFLDYVRVVDMMGSAYSVECAMCLLDLDWGGRESFVKTLVLTKAKAADMRHHDCSGLVAGAFGWSFVATDSGQDAGQLYKQLMSLMVLKKYATKSRTWIGFGWDVHSNNLLDMALYVSFDWYEDAEMAKMVAEFLHPGKEIRL